MPAIQFKGALEKIESEEEITVDLSKGVITSGAGAFDFPPFSKFVQGILGDGGLVEHTKKTLNNESAGTQQGDRGTRRHED